MAAEATAVRNTLDAWDGASMGIAWIALVSSPLSAQVQAREGSAVAEELDFDERLAAIARELDM